MIVINKIKDVLLILLVAITFFGVNALRAQPSVDPLQPTVMITGSNRGIGFELVKVFHANNWNVVATARSPNTSEELNNFALSNNYIVIEQLDVTSQSDIDQLSEKYMNVPIDILINNAGIYGSREGQIWGQMDPELFYDVMHVNVLAPLKITEAFIDSLLLGDHKKVVSITSGAGSVSIPQVSNGGIYYSISKTALNMAMRKMAAEPGNQGITFALVAPGLTDTDMLRVARPGLLGRAHSPAVSASGIFEVILNVGADYNGLPLNYDGSVIAW